MFEGALEEIGELLKEVQEYCGRFQNWISLRWVR